MVSLNVTKLLVEVRGVARLRKLLRQHNQPVPEAAAVAQWKARNTLPKRWLAPVLYVLAREGVDPLSILDLDGPAVTPVLADDDPFALADEEAA